MKKLFTLFMLSVLTFTFAACSDDDDNNGKSSKVSVQSNGKEVQNNDVLKYEATENIFGEYVAGNEMEPVFTAKTPCKLSVSVTLPANELSYLKWCGITHECENLKDAKTYTRSIDNLLKEAMEMQACFQTGVYTTCKVKVEVRADNRPVRTFYIEYVYSDKKQ